eukprot:SAG31_NODE_29102_length_400_cov_1.534884_1_plen_96_part_10
MEKPIPAPPRGRAGQKGKQTSFLGVIIAAAVQVQEGTDAAELMVIKFACGEIEGYFEGTRGKGKILIRPYPRDPHNLIGYYAFIIIGYYSAVDRFA